MNQSYPREEFIPDYKSRALTRLHVKSHSLRIETGRWRRTPSDTRMCNWDEDAVQREEHVLLVCLLSQTVRQRFKFKLYNYESYDGGQR